MREGLLAACMMHVEGYYSTKSVAFKHKNPGNIRDTPTSYKVYAKPLDGYSALVRNILVNKGKTLEQFINKYAPPSENDTASYLDIVSTLSGIQKDEVL